MSDIHGHLADPNPADFDAADVLVSRGATTRVQCLAATLQKDDRWGGFLLQCDLPMGPHTVHQHAMNGCEPVATLTWAGTYESDSQDGAT